MNGDEVRAIVSEVAALKAVSAERERSSESFRHELRETFRDVKGAITEHAAEDTRRFERVDTSLDHKITGLYEFLEQHARDERAQAWKIAGVIVTAALGVLGVVISASKAGWL